MTASYADTTRTENLGYQLLDVGVQLAVDERLHFGGVGVLYDHRLGNGGLFGTAGVMLDLNRYHAEASALDSTLTFGGNTYSAADVGNLGIDIRWSRIAPYLGVGFRAPSDGARKPEFELGALFQGATRVSFAPSGVVSANPAIFSPYLDTLRTQLQRRYALPVYPVLRINVPVGGRGGSPR